MKIIKSFKNKRVSKGLRKAKTNHIAKKESSVYIHSKSTKKNSSIEFDQEELESQNEVFYDAREEETPKTDNV